MLFRIRNSTKHQLISANQTQFLGKVIDVGFIIERNNSSCDKLVTQTYIRINKI